MYKRKNIETGLQPVAFLQQAACFFPGILKNFENRKKIIPRKFVKSKNICCAGHFANAWFLTNLVRPMYFCKNFETVAILWLKITNVKLRHKKSLFSFNNFWILCMDFEKWVKKRIVKSFTMAMGLALLQQSRWSFDLCTPGFCVVSPTSLLSLFLHVRRSLHVVLSIP